MAGKTTIHVTKSDRERIERLKIHRLQPAGEVVAEALEVLEEQRQRRAQEESKLQTA